MDPLHQPSVRSNFLKSFNTDDPVAKYCTERSLKLDPWVNQLLEDTLKRQDSFYVGAPEVIQLNVNLMKAIGAIKVLDIGVYTGYSALAAALTIPAKGTVVACDITDSFFKETGEKYFQKANVMHKLKLCIGPADTTLAKMIENGESGTYDFAFIDANKQGYNSYYELCLELLRPRGIITLDNMLWDLKVLKDEKDADTQALYDLAKFIHSDDRVDCSLLREGDGVMMVVKKEFSHTR